MEKRTPLYLYLEKLKSGDQTFLPKLCQQLSDRLVYVPIIAGPEGRKTVNRALTVKVVKIKSGDHELIPIFTTERGYRFWAEKFEDRTEYISLLGGDFCGALSPETWISIDPGAEHSVEIDPDTVRKVAVSTTTEIGSATGMPLPEAMFGQPTRGRSGPTALMPRPQRPQVNLDESSITPHGQSRNQPMLPEPPTTGKPINEQLKQIKREQFPAYQPIAPLAENAADNAVQRTVIFSPDKDANRVVREKETPGKGKKRSFLKFLKGD